MTYHASTRAVVTCSVCGSTNTLTAQNLHSDECVACSHCGSVLGSWTGLLQGQDTKDESWRLESAKGC